MVIFYVHVSSLVLSNITCYRCACGQMAPKAPTTKYRPKDFTPTSSIACNPFSCKLHIENYIQPKPTEVLQYNHALHIWFVYSNKSRVPLFGLLTIEYWFFEGYINYMYQSILRQNQKSANSFFTTHINTTIVN